MPKPILGNGDFTLPKSIVLPGLPIPNMSPLEVWIVEKPEKHKIQTSAHSQSQLNSVVWLDNQSIATCGQDGNVKIWDVDLKDL